MKTSTKKEKLYARINLHGEAILQAFPNATEKDAVKLCKKLLRIENKQTRANEDFCNGYIDSLEEISNKTLEQVCKLLGVNFDDAPIFINQDPRGYALKTFSAFANVQQANGNYWFYRDMGGYGILAPLFEEGVNY